MPERNISLLPIHGVVTNYIVYLLAKFLLKKKETKQQKNTFGHSVSTMHDRVCWASDHRLYTTFRVALWDELTGLHINTDVHSEIGRYYKIMYPLYSALYTVSRGYCHSLLLLILLVVLSIIIPL